VISPTICAIPKYIDRIPINTHKYTKADRSLFLYTATKPVIVEMIAQENAPKAITARGKLPKKPVLSAGLSLFIDNTFIEATKIIATIINTTAYLPSLVLGKMQNEFFIRIHPSLRQFPNEEI
jgi:hypothetical protein